MLPACPYRSLHQPFRALDKAGTRDRIMDAIPYYEGDVRMIDGPSVRVRHCAATLKPPGSKYRTQPGRSSNPCRDRREWPARQPSISEGPMYAIKAALELLDHMREGQMLPAGKACGANGLREFVRQRGGWVDIPPKSSLRDPVRLLALSLQGAQSGRTPL